MKPFISLARPARSSRRRARCLIAERLEDRTLLSTFSVSNTDDHGAGSLRQAIVDANNNANVGGFPDEIDFDIPGSGLQVISPTSGLPPITDPVVIDGYTQPGSSPNTVVDGDSATLLIVLDGSLDPLADGLLLYAGNSTVRGLVINGFNEGIRVSSVGGNVIEGNFIGTDATGLLALGNTDEGIDVDDSPGNTIGGSTPEARNVISGTLGHPRLWVWQSSFMALLRSATWCRGTSSAPMPPAPRIWGMRKPASVSLPWSSPPTTSPPRRRSAAISSPVTWQASTSWAAATI